MQVLSETRSLYDAITEKIIQAIKNGASPFKMPWHTRDASMALPVNAATNACYRGINILSLWLDGEAKGFPTSHWASYRQWQRLGAQVRRGERGSAIVFFTRNERQDDGQGEAEQERAPFFWRRSHVFNAAQVEGWTLPLPMRFAAFEIDKQVEAFVAATGARVGHGFGKARYRIDLDTIEMPSPAWFIGTVTSSPSQSYHAVLLHELVHWSGASHRIGRAFGKRFGDRAYAFEELIAELGAAFLCSALGIANEPRPDHAAYVASWLEVLDRDHKAIFTAAGQAQQAVEYLSDEARANG